MGMKAEEYFRGLLNKEGRTVPEDYKPYFDKKVTQIKDKNKPTIVSQAQVEQRIKEKNAEPVEPTTDQKVNMFKEKYKHLLMPKA